MMKKITLDFFSDPGHGWVRFSLVRLAELGMLNEISPYSYQRGKYVFLEEDRDLGRLTARLQREGYRVFNWKHHSTNRQSKIRGYASYGSN